MAKKREWKGIEINGSILRVALQERGLSRKALADYCEVSEQAVSNWIWNEWNPLEDNFYKICEFLDISPKMLAMSSNELIEHGRTNRIVRFHTREMMGLNDDPDYRETREIYEDLISESERESEEEEVREEEPQIHSPKLPHSNSERTAEGDDDLHG